jgi:tetratricopeptide (TPR) repeat protein
LSILLELGAALGLGLLNANLHYRLAICLANLDRVDEARAALEKCENLHPGWLSEHSSWQPYADTYRNDKFFAGLRKHALMV